MNRMQLQAVAISSGKATAIGLVGGLLAWMVTMPSPWLLGSMLATAATALAGRPTELPEWVRNTAFLLLAVSMGAAVTPDTLAAMLKWPLSLLILAVTVPVLVVTVQCYLTAQGWDRREAMLAAMPGALSYVVAATVSLGLDPRRVALAQSLRLFLVITLLPFVFGADTSADLTVRSAETTGQPSEVLLVLTVSGLTGLAAHMAKVPGSWLIGGLVGSGVLHGSGLAVAMLPPALLIPALIVTGIAIGGRFAGTGLSEITPILPQALVAIALALAICGAGAALVAFLLVIPLAEAMLAFAPGGLEVAAVLALSLGYDPTYVATHQLARFAGIALALPWLVRPLNRD